MPQNDAKCGSLRMEDLNNEECRRCHMYAMHTMAIALNKLSNYDNLHDAERHGFKPEDEPKPLDLPKLKYE